MPQQRKFFPGWLVVASGFVIMATCYTIFVNCMSLFQPLIVSDLGISLAQYNISNAISTVVSVIGSLVIGHVADKVSGRVLGSLTVIATSAVLASMSFVGELWQVYVLFAVSGCFAVASTRLLISLVTANWFTAKRGLAISIALSGSGFGGAILSPIVSSLIVGVGWRSAFLVLAAICMVAALPIRVQAVWHGRPRQGHGYHHLARDGRRHRGRHCLGRAVRRHGLLCEHLDRVLGVLRGHARVPAGIRAHRRQAARERGGGVSTLPRLPAHPTLPAAVLGAEWMLVPSFGFQGRRRPKDDPYSSVPKESRDPKGTEEKGSVFRQVASHAVRRPVRAVGR